MNVSENQNTQNSDVSIKDIKHRKRRVTFALFIVFLCLLTLAVFRQFFPFTSGIPGGVAILDYADIGGMPQWFLARGQDPSLPVLLWLHGGPGSAQIPIARHYNSTLEQEFIVVHWDQRGAGKSNPPGFDESTMTFEQYCRDVDEMTHFLKKKFGKEKIYIAGHSWGTQIGLAAVCSHPEDYFAYIAISQVVSPDRGDLLAYDWLSTQLTEDSEALTDLRSLGDPPYTDHDTFVQFIKMVDKQGGGMDAPMAELMLWSLGASEYRLSDYFQWLDGANRGSGPMWEEMLGFDALMQYPSIDVPVYFFCGRNDYNTPLSLVKKYTDQLEASKGKHLVIFEQSSHAPFIGEPDKFLAEMINVKIDTLNIHS